MEYKNYMVWTCERALPDEYISKIERVIERGRLYGALPRGTESTYNCADNWKRHRDEWKEILLDGSRFETIVTASLPTAYTAHFFWQGPLVGRFIGNRSPRRFMKVQPCPDSIAFVKPLNEALAPANGMFKIYPGSEHLKTEEELQASGIAGDTIVIARNQLLVIGSVWVEAREEGGAIFLWAGFSSHLIGLYDHHALEFIQSAYKGEVVD